MFLTTRDETSSRTVPTYTAALRTPGFAALLAIWTATIAATSLQVLALSVVVYELSGSTFLTGLAFAAGFLPQVVGGLTATSLADRWPPRLLVSGGATLGLGTALVLATVELPPLAMIGLVAAVAVTTPLFTATQSLLAAQLLPRDLYVLGRSMLTIAASGAQLGGLAAGGALIAALGGREAMLTCAAGFGLTGLLAVLALPRSRPEQGPDAANRWRLGDTWRTTRDLLADTQVRRLLVLFWFPVSVFVAAESLVVPYAHEIGSAQQVGLLLATIPVGALVGDVLVGRWLAEQTQLRLVRPLVALMGAGLVAVTLAPSLALAAVLLGAASVGFAYQLGPQRTFLDAVPTERQGQAFGLLSTGTMAGQGAGPLVLGALADHTGAGVGIAGAGTLLLLYAIGSARPIARTQQFAS
jgi:predicted MFS family arabinose efflux permease